MGVCTETEAGLPRMEAPYAEVAAARPPGGVSWAGAVGSAVLIQLAWTACGRPGLVLQGDRASQLVPDGEATRLVAELVSRG